MVTLLPSNTKRACWALYWVSCWDCEKKTCDWQILFWKGSQWVQHKFGLLFDLVEEIRTSHHPWFTRPQLQRTTTCQPKLRLLLPCHIYIYNIACVFALSKSYWAVMNKIFIYARPCVYKMTSAFFKTSSRVTVLLSCSAVFFLFKIWRNQRRTAQFFYRHWLFRSLSNVQ